MSCALIVPCNAIPASAVQNSKGFNVKVSHDNILYITLELVEIKIVRYKTMKIEFLIQ